MPNPLYQSLNNGPNKGLMEQFNQFRSMFTGDPKAQVQRMLQSGQITQDQFNRVAQMATQIRNSMK